MRHVAWKVGPSGDLATSAFAKAVVDKGMGNIFSAQGPVAAMGTDGQGNNGQGSKLKAKIIASGYYTWWQGEDVG
jgi:hypothetical protein